MLKLDGREDMGENCGHITNTALNTTLVKNTLIY
jgi:hypothetical protein